MLHSPSSCEAFEPSLAGISPVWTGEFQHSWCTMFTLVFLCSCCLMQRTLAVDGGDKCSGNGGGWVWRDLHRGRDLPLRLSLLGPGRGTLAQRVCQAMRTPALGSLGEGRTITMAIDHVRPRCAVVLAGDAGSPISEHLDSPGQHQRDGGVDLAL